MKPPTVTFDRYQIPGRVQGVRVFWHRVCAPWWRARIVTVTLLSTCGDVKLTASVRFPSLWTLRRNVLKIARHAVRTLRRYRSVQRNPNIKPYPSISPRLWCLAWRYERARMRREADFAR